MSMRRLALCLLLAAAGVEAAEPDAAICVDVRIGENRDGYWRCLNEQLAHRVASEKERQEQAAAALAASVSSGPPGLNLFDEAATAQRLGTAFGRSTVPQRPAETFRDPLVSK